MEKTVEPYNSFYLDIKNMGGFPDLTYMKVIWIGGSELYNIQKSIDENLSTLFKKERKIVPHMTLCRVKYNSSIMMGNLAEIIKNNKDIKIDSFEVNELLIKKSALTNKGPFYETISKIVLNK